MSPEQIEVMMRLRGANEYTRGMQKATVATSAYGRAAAKAGVEAKAGATGIDAISASSKKGVGSLEKMKRVGANMRSTGRSITTSVSLPVVAAGAYAIHTAANFEKSMSQVKVAGNVGGEGMKSLEDLAIKMGNETIFSANDSAEAMLEMVKTGITPAQVEAGALASAMQLAATEGMNLGRTSEIMGASMNTFKISANESAVITDALAGGALASSASVEGLAQSLAQGGQSAAMYGISVQETVGALAAFAQNGIQASDAGTSFKTFMMRLNPTQKKQKELMDKLNLSFFDQQGKMVGLVEVSKRLRTALSGYTDEQRNAYLQTLFGSDAQRAANIIYREGPKGLKGYISATEKRGAAEKMANAQMKGLPGAIERMKGSLETAALVIGQAMTPVIMDLADFISNLAQGFSELSPEVQTFIIIGAGVLAMIGPVVWIVGSLITAITGLATAVLFLVSPVGLILIALVAAAVGFWYLYENVEWFRSAVDTVVGFIKSNWRTVGPYLLFPLMPFAAIVLLVIANLDWLKNAFNNTVTFFRRLPSRIMDGIRALPRLFGRVVGAMVVFWATLPVRILKLQWKLVGVIVSTIINAGPRLLSAGVEIIGDLLSGLVQGWVSVTEWARGVPGKLAEVIGELASEFFNIGKDIASEIAKGFYESLPGPLKDTLGAVGDAAGWAGGAAGDVGGWVAGGGPFGAEGISWIQGGPTLIGEHGPEILNLPRGGELVGASRTRRELRGGGGSVRPLRTRGGPTPMKLNPSRQNGANKRTIRHEVPIHAEFKVDRRKFGEAMALAIIDETVNE